jgi:hypothetical protein
MPIWRLQVGSQARRAQESKASIEAWAKNVGLSPLEG